MAIENQFKITGTLYSKDTRVIPNKKKPLDPPWEFRSIKLEIKRTYLKADSNGIEQPHTITELPEFHLNNGVGFDDFEVKDLLDVTFSLVGKKISDTWHKTELKAIHMKFADIDGQPQSPRKPQDRVFVAPEPTREDSPQNDESDLPF